MAVVVSAAQFQDQTFDTLLRLKWDEAMSNGVFRYDLSDAVTRTIPGKYKFIVQRNPKRFTHRRVPDSVGDLKQPFDPASFNFMKIKDKEILLKLRSNNATDIEAREEDWIIVNVSPICYGHVLYVPSPSKQLPQVLTASSITSVINLVTSNENRSFCVVANSLLAHASVNHLHYHGLYIEEDFLARNVSGVHMIGTCYQLINSPVPGYGFTDASIEKLGRDVHLFLEVLLGKGIPHNLTVVWGRQFEAGENSECVRVLLFPRKPVYGMKQLFGENKDKPLFFQAALELGGFVPIMDESRFATVTEEDIAEVLSNVALKKDTLDEIERDFHSQMESLN